MKLTHALIAALLACCSLSSAQAALFDFSFTFSNRDGSYAGGTITGIVRGLTDNATSAASSVEITGNSDGFGLGEYIGNPLFNSWTMSGGLIAGYSFFSRGVGNSAPAVTCCTLLLDSTVINGTGLQDSPMGGGFSSARASISFTRLQTSVPEPDASCLLAAAAVGIGAAVRKSRRSGARLSRT